jgi:hypothetical protein
MMNFPVCGELSEEQEILEIVAGAAERWATESMGSRVKGNETQKLHVRHRKQSATTIYRHVIIRRAVKVERVW